MVIIILVVVVVTAHFRFLSVYNNDEIQLLNNVGWLTNLKPNLYLRLKSQLFSIGCSPHFSIFPFFWPSEMILIALCLFLLVCKSGSTCL